MYRYKYTLFSNGDIRSNVCTREILYRKHKFIGKVYTDTRYDLWLTLMYDFDTMVFLHVWPISINGFF